MPTISQLPPVKQVTAADQVPLSQAGTTGAVSVGTLLSGTQPAILAKTGTLLGRTSLGPGGPEPVTIGAGLTLSSTSLAATGTDHASFAPQTSLVPTDQVVVNSSGQPRLLNISLLRDLFSAGNNVAISTAGEISATGGGQATSIDALPAGSSPSAGDLFGISQAGVDHAITYAALIDGQTIDMAQSAAPAQDSDTFWVAQGTSTMVRQDLSALWTWIVSRLPSVKQPVVELAADTTLDTTVHNKRILVCSQPVTLTAATLNVGSGFSCDVINMSSGAVTLSGAVVTSSGNAAIPAGQTATIRCVAYSGGTVIYAALSGTAAASSPPAAVSGLSPTSATQDSVSLAWVPVVGASSYVVEYRVAGNPAWIVAGSGLAGTNYTVGNLASSTSYEFGVLAINSAGSSATVTTTTATTAAPLAVPGQVTGLAAGTVTANSVDLTWSAPTTGGAVAGYTVRYRLSPTGSWTVAGSGITGTQYAVTGLATATAYDFQVSATNAAGAGTASTTVTASTPQAAGSVTAITWNVVPASGYTHGTGSIAVNVHVTPGTAAVQFGLSTSASVMPTSWIAGSYVNSDLWGAYLSVPATTGTWYAWASGTDGSCPTVYPTSFTVA